MARRSSQGPEVEIKGQRQRTYNPMEVGEGEREATGIKSCEEMRRERLGKAT